MKRTIILTIFSVVLFSCGGGSDTEGEDTLAQQRIASAYVAEILSIMRNNALTRNEVDWGQLETEVNQLASGAESIRDTYPAITRALELINTNHSFLSTSTGNIITYPSNLRCDQDIELIEPAVDGIGYIRVDGFSSRNSAEGQAFATDIQARIAEQDNPSITAWIVDLRNNTGGNMWPMIAGLGPLFEGNTLGFFIDPDENIRAWGYANGGAYLMGQTITQIDAPYTLINPLPKIAVLSSQRVGSSGEATLIAFKKQFNVRFFGTASCGLSTANTSFELIDGSILFLTTALIADREQQTYGARVSVDQETSPENTLAEAIAWLQQ